MRIIVWAEPYWQRWRSSINPISGILLLCLWLSGLFFVVSAFVRGVPLASSDGGWLLVIASCHGISVTVFALRKDFTYRTLLPNLVLLPLMAYFGYSAGSYIAPSYVLLLMLLAVRLELIHLLILTTLFYISYVGGSYASARAYDLVLDRGWMANTLFIILGVVLGVYYLVRLRHKAEATTKSLEVNVETLRHTAAHLGQQWRQLLRLNRHLLALHEIARTINQTSADIEETLRQIADLSVQVLGIPVCTISLISEDGRTWSGIAASHPNNDLWRRQTGRIYEKSTMRQIVVHKQPVVVDDVTARQEYREWMAHVLDIRSFMALPLQVRGEVEGTVILGTAEAHRFTPEEVDLGRSLADHIAIAIDNARLVERERRKAHQLVELHRLATALNSEMVPDAILDQVAEMACLLLAAPACNVLMVEEGQREMVCRVSKGVSEGFASLQPVLLEAGRANSRQISSYRIIEKTQHDSSDEDITVQCVLMVPLEHQGRRLGLLNIYRDGDGCRFGEDEVELAQTLAAYASTSLVKAELLQQTAEVEAIKEAERLKMEFVSVVSHELRTPLTTIVGMSELLRDFPVTAQQGREMAEAIHREGRRLTHLIDDLLDMGRLEEGRLELRIDEVDLAAILHEMAAQAAIFAANHVVQVTVGPSLPPAKGDANRIRQILFNLLTNAAHYSPGGSTISVEARAVDGFAEVSVADQGVGIAPDELSHIFDKFYRGRGTATDPKAGVGLGLYITRSLVEMQGGNIRVESEPDKGSTFTFTLPLSDPHQTMQPTLLT